MSNSVTIEFTEDEVRLLHNALRSFLSDFGHDEADIVAQLRALIAKLPQASPS